MFPVVLLLSASLILHGKSSIFLILNLYFDLIYLPFLLSIRKKLIEYFIFCDIFEIIEVKKWWINYEQYDSFVNCHKTCTFCTFTLCFLSCFTLAFFMDDIQDFIHKPCFVKFILLAQNYPNPSHISTC